jgi:hypothetical protein
LQFGQDLWAAYKSDDLEELIRLAENQSPAFPYLQEVVKAHVERFPKDGTKGRPERVLEEITKIFQRIFSRYLKNLEQGKYLWFR